MQVLIGHKMKLWSPAVQALCIPPYCCIQWCDWGTTRWPFTLAYYVILKCAVSGTVRIGGCCTYKTADTGCWNAGQYHLHNTTSRHTSMVQWYYCYHSTWHQTSSGCGYGCSRCLFWLYCFFAHWDEEILINGYARSRILLQEGKKGKYMCCLVFKQGLHKEKTCAILIILFRLENVAKKQRAEVRAIPLDKDRGNIECAKWCFGRCT